MVGLRSEQSTLAANLQTPLSGLSPRYRVFHRLAAGLKMKIFMVDSRLEKAAEKFAPKKTQGGGWEGRGKEGGTADSFCVTFADSFGFPWLSLASIL